MSLVLRCGSAAFGILQRDAAVFMSYRFRFVAQIASTLFTLFLLFYISKLVQVDAFPSPEDYFAFVTVGLVIFGVLTSTLALGPAGSLELRVQPNGWLDIGEKDQNLHEQERVAGGG